MDLTRVTAVVMLLVALSIAAERFVEIIKGFIPALDQPKEDPRLEGRRHAILQALAVVAGVLTAFVARPYVPAELFDVSSSFGVVGLGLLASGGSGLWNSILGVVSGMKDLKKVEVDVQKENMPVPPGTHRDLDLGAEQVTSNECYDVEGV